MELDLGDKLTPANWERALLAMHPYVETGWKPTLSESGLVIDLSKVGWVEPGSIVRLVLFVEAALAEAVNVEIRLPLATRSQAELELTQEASQLQSPELRRKFRFIQKYVERRRDAVAVLDRFGLRAVLSAPHVQALPGKCAIVDSFDWSSTSLSNAPSLPLGEESTAETAESEVDPWYVSIIFPMRWMSDPRSSDGKAQLDEMSSVGALADVIVHPSYRIVAADSQTLAHVFLKELVENAIDHAGRGHALIAAWQRPREVGMKEAELLESDRAFANWCSRYPLIEVTAGDSGVGLPSTLRGEFLKKHRLLPTELEHSDENSCILIWALDKWSTRFPHEKQRGTRGLYRVERVVRKYDGFLSLRAERSYAGIDAHTQRYFGYQRRLARCPGTTCQVRLPVMVAHKQPPLAEPSRPLVAAPKVLRFPDLDWQGSPTKSITVLTQMVAEQASVLSPTGPSATLVVDLAFASLDRRVLEGLLSELTQIAHPLGIVVLNLLAPGWDATEQTVQSLKSTSQSSTAETKDHTNVVDPILLVHADGHHAWVGATDEIARILDILLQKGECFPDELNVGSLPIEHFNALLRQLAEDYHIIHRLPGSSISLRFSIADADQALRAAIRKEVSDSTLRQMADFATDVAYRTPSLELVSRFLDIDEVLGPDLRSRLAVLASECVDRLGLADLSGSVSIITDSKTNWNVLNVFRQQLQLRLGNRLRVETQQLGPSDIPVIPANTYSIAFTTVTLTGSLLARLSGQIVRAKRVPQAAIAVVDARRHPSMPLEAMRHAMPVVSLTTACTVWPHTRPPQTIFNISPVDLDLEMLDKAFHRSYEISIKRLREMIAIDGGIYFAHVWRPNGRHFTFYLDASDLIGMGRAARDGQMSDSGKEILAAYITQADKWRSGEAVDLVCYPITERPSTAEFLSERLAEHLKAALCPISRAGESSHWRFPGRISIPSVGVKPDLFTDAPNLLPHRVLVIDWGAITGRSILAMIRLAAKTGAKHIGVIVFLSQLSEDDEELLQSLDSMNVESSAEPVRVRIVFLSRLPIRPYDVQHCPYCRQLHRLLVEEKSLPQSLLQEFITEARSKLRPISLSQLKDPQVSGPQTATPTDIFEMALLRDRLERAAVLTSERWDLYLEIERAASDYDHGPAELRNYARRLIRFLAVEWPWLKHEPLSLRKFRKALAQLTIAIAVHPESSESEQIDAVIVLRTASKEEFAYAVPKLFEAFLTRRMALSQLLYSTFTYLDRDYLFPEMLAPLVDALGKCSEPLIRHGISADKLGGLGLTHKTLEHYGRYLLRTSAAPTPSEAWRALRTDLDANYHVHHPVCMAADALRLKLLEPSIEDPSQPLPEVNWCLIRRGWEERCVPFVLERLLPLVGVIRSVIDGFDAKVILANPTDLDGLAELANGRVFSEAAIVSWCLLEFEQDPQSVRRPGKWRGFANARDRISRLLLNPGDVPSRKGGSALIRLLMGCPADLRAVIPSQIVGSLVGDPRLLIDWEIEDPSVPVFCHESTVIEVVTELLSNILKHCLNVTKVRIVVGPAEDGTAVHVFNDGQRKKHVENGRLTDIEKMRNESSRGLETCRERLQAYGARLKVDDSERDGWTFIASIEFERG